MTFLDKVRAVCSSVGIGTPIIKPGAIAESMADIKSKAMLKCAYAKRCDADERDCRGNVYADDVSGYI